jgi:hypothetical protein
MKRIGLSITEGSTMKKRERSTAGSGQRISLRETRKNGSSRTIATAQYREKAVLKESNKFTGIVWATNMQIQRYKPINRM